MLSFRLFFSTSYLRLERTLCSKTPEALKMKALLTLDLSGCQPRHRAQHPQEPEYSKALLF